MGYLDNITPPKKDKSKTPGVAPKSTGYLDSIPLPKKPAPGPVNSILSSIIQKGKEFILHPVKTAQGGLNMLTPLGAVAKQAARVGQTAGVVGLKLTDKISGGNVNEWYKKNYGYSLDEGIDKALSEDVTVPLLGTKVRSFNDSTAGTLAGEALNTVAFGAKNPYVIGGLVGAGTAMEEKKDYPEVALTAAAYALGGKVLEVGINKAAPYLIRGFQKYGNKLTQKLLGVLPDSERAAIEALEKKVKVPVTSESPIDTPVSVSTPGTRYADYRKSQGYEPYQNPDELPVIDIGKKAVDESGLPRISPEDAPPKVYSENRGYEPYTKPEDLPVIDMEGKITTLKKPVDTGPDFTFEPIKDTPKPKQTDIISSIIQKGKESPELRAQLPQRSPIQTVTGEAPRFEPKAPVIEEAPKIVPALAKQTEVDAVEKGLISRFDGLPEASRMNMKEQAQGASDFVASNYDKAKRVAMGNEAPPGTLRDASVFEAVKQRALQEGDVSTLRSLATESTIPGKLTAYGQEIKAADNLVDSNDPVELMQSVIKSREKGLQTKTKVKSQDVAQIKDSIKKSAPKKQDWDAFITSIEC